MQGAPSAAAKAPHARTIALRQRPTLAQRRALFDLQLATRLAFLDARLSRFRKTVLNAPEDQPASAWPAPTITQLSPQDATAILHMAGEFQRLKAVASLHTLELSRCGSDRLDDLIAKEQASLIEIPALTMGSIGIWGQRHFLPEGAAATRRAAEAIGTRISPRLGKRRRIDSEDGPATATGEAAAGNTHQAEDTGVAPKAPAPEPDASKAGAPEAG